MSKLIPQQLHPMHRCQVATSAQAASRRPPIAEQLEWALWWSVSVAVASALVGLPLAAALLLDGVGASDWLIPALCLGGAAAHGYLALFVATLAANANTILKERQ